MLTITLAVLLATVAFCRVEEDQAAGGEPSPTPESIEKVKYLAPYRPKHVALATEDNFFSLQKKNDVVVLLVTRQFACSDCAATHKQFIEASQTVHAMSSKKGDGSSVLTSRAANVKFAVLDADEEMEELIYLLELSNRTPEDAGSVPSILVFKREFQFMQKRPPIQFLLNDRVAADLSNFALRLAGDGMDKVGSEKELQQVATYSFTDTVSFVVHNEQLANHPAFQRVVTKRRTDTVFLFTTYAASVSSPLEAFHTKDDGSVERLAFSGGLDPEGEFDVLFPKLLSFVDQKLLLRPGHEFDQTPHVVVRQMNLSVSKEECEKKKAVKGDRGVFHFIGLNLATGVRFMDMKEADAEVGGFRGDLPASLLKKGLQGMCPGMQRKVVIPPQKGYELGNEPPDVAVDDRLQFTVTMTGWDEMSLNEQEVREAEEESTQPRRDL